MFEIVVTNGEGVMSYHGVVEWFMVVDAIERHMSGPEILMAQVSPLSRQDFHGTWQ